MCSGRRGTKRKAEVQVEEEKPSVEEEEGKGEEENGQQGKRVVIEHWWATSWWNTYACMLLIIHVHQAFNTFKMYSNVKVFKSIPSFSAFTECIVTPDIDFTFEQPCKSSWLWRRCVEGWSPGSRSVFSFLNLILVFYIINILSVAYIRYTRGLIWEMSQSYMLI